jgi:hypothetical protein
MNTADIFKMVAKREADVVSELASELELSVRVHAEPYTKDDGTQSGTQYRGRNSRKGEIRTRIWVGGKPADNAGEILVVRPDDITKAEPVVAGGVKLARFEFRRTASDNSLIILWVPAEGYEFKSLKVILP